MIPARSLADALLKRLDEHDIPLRELEYATYTFDLVMDQGALRRVQAPPHDDTGRRRC